MPFRVVTGTRHTIGQPFATSIHPSGRYFLDQWGNPFLLCGASDQTIQNLSASDMQLVMQTRAAQGFNWAQALIISSQSEDLSTGSPDWAFFDGVVPFYQSDGSTQGTGPANYDCTKPYEPYWARIDTYFSLAKANGVTLLVDILDPILENDSSFYTLMGNTKLATYAAWFANRYKSFTYHHLWSYDHFTTRSGGWAASDPAITAMLNAVRGANPKCLQTIENNDGLHTVNTANLDLSSDDTSWTLGSGTSQLDMNWMYDARDNSPDTTRAYNLGTAAPVFFGEGLYDSAPAGKNTWSNLLNRKYLWFPMVNGAAGSFYGHDTVWHFGTGWQSVLTTSATPHVAIWKAFMTSIRWWTLVPDTAAAFVSTGNSYSAGSVGTNGAVSADGSLGLVYMPANASVTVTMTKMRGTTTANWVDPTNGAYTLISSSLTNTGTHTFTSSTNNAGGDPDWALLLTA